ncbi:MAG: SpoIID/LytB domain-containing protein [Acidimicrobiales bacterium]
MTGAYAALAAALFLPLQKRRWLRSPVRVAFAFARFIARLQEGIQVSDLSTNMAHIRNIKRCAALLACALLGVVAGPVLLATGAAATQPSVLAPFPASNIEFVGYGDGPGLGLGEWGAFGYAVLDHEPYRWILAHYYGGITLSSGGNLASGDPMISVDIDENDGQPVIVTSASAFSFGGYSFLGGQAARAVLSSGEWTLSEAPSCSSRQWAQVASQLVDPVATPSSLRPSATSGQVLDICEHGGADLAVRGTVEAYDAPNGAVTLNTLPIEEYVRDVISAEVSWSWGLFGGSAGSPQGQPWGFQALEAQAVATRSYVVAELAAGGWEPYATTCDSYCQSYQGMADEMPDLDAAVADTAGQILEQPAQAQPAQPAQAQPAQPAQAAQPVQPQPAQPAQSEVPVLADYSASTGGYTGGGPFPGVVDSGDAICIKSSYYTCNPCHKWLALVPVHAVERTFESVGKLAAVEVTQRNGLGALGGRVESIEIVGTSGAELSVPSYELEPLLARANPDHCASDWFGVVNGP